MKPKGRKSSATHSHSMSDANTVRRRLAYDFRRCREGFRVLGDGHRQDIILLLLENETIGMSVGEITKRIGLSRPSVSYHLRIMKDAGIVDMVTKGTSNIYYLDPEAELWELLGSSTADACELIGQIRKKWSPEMIGMTIPEPKE